jgi:hypothetical protein
MNDLALPGPALTEHPGVRTIVDAFASADVSFDPDEQADYWHLFAMRWELVPRSEHPEDEDRYQASGTKQTGPDTRGPVASLEQAINDLVAALASTQATACLPEAPDRINAAARLAWHLDEMGLDLMMVMRDLDDVRRASRDALELGNHTEQKPPTQLVYARLVRGLAHIYREKTGRDPLTEARIATTKFARVVLRAEAVLPAPLRAGKLTKVKDRIEAALESG